MNDTRGQARRQHSLSLRYLINATVKGNRKSSNSLGLEPAGFRTSTVTSGPDHGLHGAELCWPPSIAVSGTIWHDSDATLPQKGEGKTDLML